NEAATQGAASLPHEERSQMEAYARGVNAFIESHRNHLPIEFRILRYQPRSWEVRDTFLIGANMVKALNHGTFEDELIREAITAKIGAEKTAKLFPQTSVHDVPPSPAVSVKNRQEDPNEDDDDFSPDTSVTRNLPSEIQRGDEPLSLRGDEPASLRSDEPK